jgi:hypothetical protein
MNLFDVYPLINVTPLKPLGLSYGTIMEMSTWIFTVVML